ncbi:MAG TPA: FtsX-like permease family protein, partial [Bacilli bacterium]
MSIPMYADGALKRVVAKSLAGKSDGLPAGSVLIRYQASGGDKADLDSLADVERYIKKDIPAEIGFPYQTYVASKSIRNSQIKPVDPEKVDPSKRRQMSIQTMSGLAENTEITNGQMYSNKVSNGFIEAVVMEDSLFRNVIRIGDEFTYPVSGGSGVYLKIKVVGSYKPNDENNPYWYQGFEGIVNSFMISDEVFTDYVLEQKKIALNLANWYYAFDLREIQTNQLASMTKTLKRLDIVLFQKLKDTKLDISFLPMLGEFKKQSLQLQSLLFTLAIPMIAMVFYYIAMNARQSLERQRNDIAVLRSRGGSTGQIIWIYLLENLLLGGLAILIGPFAGWFMAKSIGSSSGFLTFVDRQSIPVGISVETIFYGLIAVLIAIIASLIPAVVFAGSSIVGAKQQLARADKRPLWQKWYLDIALLGLSGYGWYLFNERQIISLQAGSDQM